ncbi:MAG: phospho-sugar mutase, partial [Oscillospiraceae bacterium]|nr:phospho-sugar mutase [Oscillospiraceae bacterium]
QSVEPGICREYPIRVAYSPLNGTGREPVLRIMRDIGVSEVCVVAEQEMPDGDFPTCTYPNPETKEALALGLKLAEEKRADLLIATDPDCDRAGVAFRDRDGGYRILSGNEIGVLLLWYICSRRFAKGTLPKGAVAVESLVSTELAGEIARAYEVEMRRVLTGFKYIGEQILRLEEKGEEERFIFGFEESCGYLSGSYVRDKDAVNASLLLCELASRLKVEGTTAPELMESLFEKYGYYLSRVESFEFAGLDGKEKMARVMSGLHENPPREIAGFRVLCLSDYKTGLKTDRAKGAQEEIDLPSSDMVEFSLEGGASLIIRPSGTEPKMKAYMTAKEKTEAASLVVLESLSSAVKELLGF